MRNVNITSCGAIQNSTSRYTRAFSSPFLKIQVAIFCSDCKNVLLTNVYAYRVQQYRRGTMHKPNGSDSALIAAHLIENATDMEALMITSRRS